MDLSKHSTTTSTKLFSTGYYLSIFGLTVILLWLGIFKFTAAEAAAVKPLLANHPFSAWMYNAFSVQTVSNIVGTFEILTVLFLLLGLLYRFFKILANAALIITFVTTTSFLFTTPGIFKAVEGIPVTDFFILKDLLLLGASLMVLNVPNGEIKYIVDSIFSDRQKRKDI
ncbi:DUF417 family protein [Pedobacter endophyticus]|uniref:DUF417 family protein n=1 Tax=Pedobacter endophyticus TaxID=2789740 RepID=A0A7U3Q572_9SPHI|nr:DUF417 family protein [Pedobacter endophyticus]QPH37972.1 DUF417 family protein [Pedobacter endophyticus]